MALITKERSGLVPRIFRVAATYVGTVVGAGFASGQETLRFFAAYGRVGLAGVALTTALFCVYGILIMELGRRLHATSHREILHFACGTTIGRIMDGLITLFLGVTLTIMVAGGGAVFAEQLHLPALWGAALTAGLTGFTILGRMRGIIAANSLVVPLLTLAVGGLSAFSIRYHGLDAMLKNALPWPELAASPHWMVSAVLYAAYNLILSISVLGPLGAEVQARRALYAGGAAGGLALGLLAGGMGLAVSFHMPEISAYEVPMLYLARLHARPVQWFYTLILWAEIYTTALACAYGFASRTAQVLGMGYREVVGAVTLLALAMSGVGFSSLVAIFYPAFGFLTLVVLISLGLVGLTRRTT